MVLANVLIVKVEKSMEALRHFSVDVYCTWSDSPPVYRIYVDNDLITERTFVWPSYKAFIREHLICNIDEGLHRIRVENTGSHGVFKLENFIYEGYPGAEHPNYQDPELKQITFVVN